MRAHYLFLPIFAAAAACSSDSNSSTGPTTPTTPITLTISVDSGFADRTGIVGTAILGSVHVTQIAGQPAPGVTVTWSTSPGGGTVNPVTSVTDATGLATTKWTLNDTARVSTLSASATGAAAVSMQVATTGGTAAAIAKVSPDSIGVVAGASTLITMKVTDAVGNPVTGAAVAWSATGGALSAVTTTTGNSGHGQVAFSTGAAPASYTVTATVAGIGALTFKVTGF
jgi:hypothetical protein